MRYALTNHSPDYLLLLNQDTTVEPNFLTELVKVAESDNKIGIVGPIVYDYYRPDVITIAGGKIDWWRGTAPHIKTGNLSHEGGNVREVDWVEGSCLLARTKREPGWEASITFVKGQIETVSHYSEAGK
jgi:GT2 family glycosyltransferase